VNKKIKVTLTRDLIKTIEQGLTATQSFSERVTHLLLRGINAEGLTDGEINV